MADKAHGPLTWKEAFSPETRKMLARYLGSEEDARRAYEIFCSDFYPSYSQIGAEKLAHDFAKLVSIDATGVI